MSGSGSAYEFIDNPFALIGLIVCSGLVLLAKTRIVKDNFLKKALIGIAVLGIAAAVIIPMLTSNITPSSSNTPAVQPSQPSHPSHQTTGDGSPIIIDTGSGSTVNIDVKQK